MNYINNLKISERVDIIKRVIPKWCIYLYRRNKYDKIWRESYVSSEAYINIKNNVIIESEVCIFKSVLIDVKNIKIGKYTDISGPTRIVGLGNVDIGNYCSIAPDVYIVTNNHNYKRKFIYPINSRLYNEVKDDHIVGNVKIGNDTWIGRGATILPNVEIGNGCVIAANSVVKAGKYEDFSIIGGNPAKIIRYREVKIDDISIYNKDIEGLM